jgi:hypothetical protein
MSLGLDSDFRKKSSIPDESFSGGAAIHSSFLFSLKKSDKLFVSWPEE